MEATIPRVSDIYSAPAGSAAVSGTTVQSAPYNGLISDLVTDANFPRPVVAGGTGGATATSARTNLGLGTTDTPQFSRVGVNRTPIYDGDFYKSGTGNVTLGVSNDSVAAVLQVVSNTQVNVGAASSHPVLLLAGNLEQLRATTTGVNVPNALTRNGYTVWDAGNSPSSLATAGYQKLQSGLIIQWGQVPSASADPTITFPISFPTACLNVQVMPMVTAAATLFYAVNVTTVTITNFKAQTRYTQTGGTVNSSNFTAYWTALGY